MQQLGFEQARPMLGNQPHLPRTTLLRYVQAKDNFFGKKLVTINPYFSKSDHQYYGAYEDIFYSYKGFHDSCIEETNLLMLVEAPMQPRQATMHKLGLLFGYGGDHWLK